MKRIIACILALLLSVSVLCACSKDGKEEAKNVELSAVLADINEKFEFPELKKVEDDKSLKRYFQIEATDVKQYAIQFAKDSTLYSAVILIEANDDEAVKKVETSLNNYLQSRLQNAKSYTPEEVSMLEKCKVETNGNYVSLVIDSNAEAIRDEYNSHF